MKKVAIGLGFLLAASTSFANNGIYVFGNTGYNQTKLSEKLDARIQGEVSLVDKKAAGGIAEIGVGYEFAPNFAVEAAYTDLGKAKAKLREKDFPKLDSNSSQTSRALRLNLVASHALNDKFDVFSKVGINFVKNKNELKDDTETLSNKVNKIMPSLGFGLAYKITDNLALQGEYDHLFGKTKSEFTDAGPRDEKFSIFETKSQSLFKVGLKYKF